MSKYPFDPKDVFSVVSLYEGSPMWDQAYIYRCGYVGNTLDDLAKSINNREEVYELLSVNTREMLTFQVHHKSNPETSRWALFLPVDKVVRPNLRPVKSWQELVKLGTGREFLPDDDLASAPSICIRLKSQPWTELRLCISAVRTREGKLFDLVLGASVCDPIELRDNYQIYNQVTHQWGPIEVLEEDEDE